MLTPKLLPCRFRFAFLLTFASTMILSLLFSQACFVEQKCFQNADCESPKICNVDGQCEYKCEKDSDCGDAFICDDHECVPDSAGDDPLLCPEEMASVANAYCMDIYEASRPDATAENPGNDNSMAVSMAGVIPWRVADNAEAAAACQAAGKEICTEAQWSFACRGPGDLTYAYGNSYEPEICNGLDTFGLGNQHLLPTGSFSECVNDFGVYDLNGNLWEHVLNGGSTKVRGGAYNCSNSEMFHRCDYIPQTWTPSALGFRCCFIPDQEDDKSGESE